MDGFVAGLHRSPDFGFSQEFAEYRAYTPGDDLRHVDWNLFARTERMYLKRYRGETNSQSDGAAGCEQVDGVYFGEWGEGRRAAAKQDGLCAVCCGFAVLSGDP